MDSYESLSQPEAEPDSREGFKVSDVVTVHGLVNRAEFNGCQGKVTISEPDVPQTGRVVIELLDGRCISVSTANLQHGYNTQVAALASGGSSQDASANSSMMMNMQVAVSVAGRSSSQDASANWPNSLMMMCWGSESQQVLFQQAWVARINAMDFVWLQRACCNVYLYLIYKLQHVLKNTKRIGQAGWALYGQPLSAIRCGCVWGQGGHEQEVPLTSHEPGEWWPLIFVISPDGILYPCYCPGLAWQNARPWYAHASRVRVVETPGVVIEELGTDSESETEWSLI